MKNVIVKLNISTELPISFTPRYEEFEKRGLGFFKIEDLPEKKEFPIDSTKSNWQIELIFDDYKCFAGKLFIPFKGDKKLLSIKGNEKAELIVNFMFSKISVKDETKPLRWATEFYNQISQSHANSIEKFLRSNREVLLEKCRQFKEFERRKNELIT